MRRLTSAIFLWLGLAALACGAHLSLFAAERHFLWQIGTPDTNNLEFALAPADYAKFDTDSFYVVGESDPKRDWSYVHPGPTDPWAGSRQHTFAILFALKTPPSPGECRFNVHLLDTHSSVPPNLRIQVNGHNFETNLPGGAGDESINGQPAKGRPYQFSIAFPSELLHAGDNDIQITSAVGCWMLYDWLGLETPAGSKLGAVSSRTLVTSVQPVRALREENGHTTQPVLVTLRHFGTAKEAALRVQGAPARTLQLQRGDQTLQVSVPAVSKDTPCTVTLETADQPLLTRQVLLKPARKLTIYILNHSHLDLGYTDVLPKVEAKQIENLTKAIALARETANNPPGSRFVWNIETSWVVDCYLRQMPPAQRAEFDQAVKNGWLSLQGLYANVLTGLCGPEELLQLTRFSLEQAKRLGLKLDSAMISDIPGFAWGTVEALAQAGIRYLSVGHNRGYSYFDNMAFWWVSQSGQQRVLVWTPCGGYDLCALIQKLDAPFLSMYQDKLDDAKYPYDISYLRWNGYGDNAAPERGATDFARDWNATYIWPKFVVASTSEAFAAFEKRCGSKLPEVRSEWAPLWEDGAGSSAFETALNRNSSDRLVQAQALFAIRAPKKYPAIEFAEAWKNVLLFSEHTWGSEMSISDPEHFQARDQWISKRGHALEADRRSRALLAQALGSNTNSDSFDVYNTCSWTRTDIVTLAPQRSRLGDRVLDVGGKPVPSQRLSSGELCLLARDIPAFGAQRFKLVRGQTDAGDATMTVTEDTLDNGLVNLRLDPATGAIVHLGAKGLSNNLADTSSARGLNDYLYVSGNRAANARRNGPARIRVKEKGPLIASLLVEAEAPGCRHFSREIRLIAGLDRVELSDFLDKERAPATPGHKDYYSLTSKESVHLAFPFAVPNGNMYINEPFATLRPDRDRMPGSQTNWFTVGHWLEVANPQFGITWTALDTPMIEVGGMTALEDAAAMPRNSQHFYVYAMNNYWHCNYRAYQEGPMTFRFALRPHQGLDLAESARFGNAYSQPLLAAPATGNTPATVPRLTLSSDDVLVTGFKPAENGNGWIMRLFGASDKDRKVTLACTDSHPLSLWLSGTAEERSCPVNGAIEVPAAGLVTVRVERP